MTSLHHTHTHAHTLFNIRSTAALAEVETLALEPQTFNQQQHLCRADADLLGGVHPPGAQLAHVQARIAAPQVQHAHVDLWGAQPAVELQTPLVLRVDLQLDPLHHGQQGGLGLAPTVVKVEARVWTLLLPK